jgi:glucose-6-phosphate isomerase
VLELQRKVLAALVERDGRPATCEELARAAGAEDEAETVFHVLERLAANPERGVARRPGATPFAAAYAIVSR